MVIVKLTNPWTPFTLAKGDRVIRFFALFACPGIIETPPTPRARSGRCATLWKMDSALVCQRDLFSLRSRFTDLLQCNVLERVENHMQDGRAYDNQELESYPFGIVADGTTPRCFTPLRTGMA
jgi:hypothetical protein